MAAGGHRQPDIRAQIFPRGKSGRRHVDKDTMIVGVVEDVAIAPGVDPAAPLSGGRNNVYSCRARWMPVNSRCFTSGSSQVGLSALPAPVEGLTAQMQRALASADPNLPFSGFYSMRDLLAKTLATQRVEVALLSAMAALALLLSAVGIFALEANIVEQKTRRNRHPHRSGLHHSSSHGQYRGPGVQASALGLILGLILCAGALRAMRSVLYGVGVYDVPTILTVVLMLASVTLIATTVPTLRIARIDPAQTLRED